MIDSHAHLDFENFDTDRESVMKRFFNDGGKAIVNIGVDWKRNDESLKIAENNKKIFTALGFHPEGGEFDLAKVEKYLKEKSQHPKVKAIGEIGLDYFHTKDKEKREFQKKLFLKQLEVAKGLDFPVVIHCRDAYDDLLEIISEKNFKELKMVIHCFCGGMKQAEKFLKFSNLLISFTGNITFVKNEDELLKVVEKVPVKRIMVETDCPFLSPVPNRGKRNEPSYVKYVIEKIADIKKTNSQKIENQTDKNAQEFFGI